MTPLKTRPICSLMTGRIDIAERLKLLLANFLHSLEDWQLDSHATENCSGIRMHQSLIIMVLLLRPVVVNVGLVHSRPSYRSLSKKHSRVVAPLARSARTPSREMGGPPTAVGWALAKDVHD